MTTLCFYGGSLDRVSRVRPFGYEVDVTIFVDGTANICRFADRVVFCFACDLTIFANGESELSALVAKHRRLDCVWASVLSCIGNICKPINMGGETIWRIVLSERC